MNSTQPFDIAPRPRSAINPLTVFLCLIMAFFCAILVFVYAATKRANPVTTWFHPLRKEPSQRRIRDGATKPSCLPACHSRAEQPGDDGRQDAA